MAGRRWICLMVALLLVGLSLPAGASALSVTDDMGRQVTFDRMPETCVSLTPGNTEILFALGLGDRVLGVDNQSNYPEEGLANKARMGDYYGPNIEAVVALAPDVVFASDKLQLDAIEQLTALGLKVVCNDPTTLSGVVPGIEMIAQVMGVDAGAVTARIDEAEEAAKLKVYFALSFGEYGNYTAGPGTFIDDIIALCRGVNVAGHMPVPWPEYPLEQLMLDDPDIILVSDYVGDGSVVEQLKTAPGYEALRCVQAGRVYAVNADITSRPGPRMAEAIEAFSQILAQAD